MERCGSYGGSELRVEVGRSGAEQACRCWLGRRRNGEAHDAQWRSNEGLGAMRRAHDDASRLRRAAIGTHAKGGERLEESEQSGLTWEAGLNAASGFRGNSLQGWPVRASSAARALSALPLGAWPALHCPLYAHHLKPDQLSPGKYLEPDWLRSWKRSFETLEEFSTREPCSELQFRPALTFVSARGAKETAAACQIRHVSSESRAESANPMTGVTIRPQTWSPRRLFACRLDLPLPREAPSWLRESGKCLPNCPRRSHKAFQHLLNPQGELLRNRPCER
jgi:hypothetical protein